MAKQQAIDEDTEGVSAQIRDVQPVRRPTLSKTVGFAYPGSNPGPAITTRNRPWPAHMRPETCLPLPRSSRLACPIELMITTMVFDPADRPPVP